MVNPNKTTQFGIEGYKCGSPKIHKAHVYCKKWNSEEKIPNMWQQIKKHAESVPSPDKYTGQPKKFGKQNFFSPRSKR